MTFCLDKYNITKLKSQKNYWMERAIIAEEKLKKAEQTIGDLNFLLKHYENEYIFIN